MRIKIFSALILASVSLLPASAQYDNKVGLPPCRNSAYMGGPGDGIRSDLGNRISGQHSPRPVMQQVGLPHCRTSPYMGQPGDGIRSDLGNRISGQRQVQAAAPQVGLPSCRTSPYMGQPGDGIRSDLGKQISGHTVQRRTQQVRYNSQPSGQAYAKAYGYADYR